jgi:hypothetical protein
MLYNYITIHGSKKHRKHKFRCDGVGGYVYEGLQQFFLYKLVMICAYGVLVGRRLAEQKQVLRENQPPLPT